MEMEYEKKDISKSPKTKVINYLKGGRCMLKEVFGTLEMTKAD